MIILQNKSEFYSSEMLVLFFEFYGVVIKVGHMIKSSKVRRALWKIWSRTECNDN